MRGRRRVAGGRGRSSCGDCPCAVRSLRSRSWHSSRRCSRCSQEAITGVPSRIRGTSRTTRTRALRRRVPPGSDRRTARCRRRSRLWRIRRTRSRRACSRTRENFYGQHIKGRAEEALEGLAARRPADGDAACGPELLRLPGLRLPGVRPRHRHGGRSEVRHEPLSPLDRCRGRRHLAERRRPRLELEVDVRLGRLRHERDRHADLRREVEDAVRRAPASRTRPATPSRASASTPRTTAGTAGTSCRAARRRCAAARSRRSSSIRRNPNTLYVGTARGVRGVTSVTGGAVSLAPDAAPWGLWKLDRRRQELQLHLGRQRERPRHHERRVRQPRHALRRRPSSRGSGARRTAARPGSRSSRRRTSATALPAPRST